MVIEEVLAFQDSGVEAAGPGLAGPGLAGAEGAGPGGAGVAVEEVEGLAGRDSLAPASERPASQGTCLSAWKSPADGSASRSVRSFPSGWVLQRLNGGWERPRGGAGWKRGWSGELTGTGLAEQFLWSLPFRGSEGPSPITDFRPPITEFERSVSYGRKNPPGSGAFLF